MRGPNRLPPFEWRRVRPDPARHRDRHMTVCIAALFNWNYSADPAKPDWGKAAIVASDRMLTSGDVQYEPLLKKVAQVGDKTLILVAGDISTHSQAVKKTHERFPANKSASPEDVAVVYGREIQAIRQKAAEDIILSPLGLNTDSFIAQQKDMADSFISTITDQLQRFQGEDVDAIIVGVENDRAIRLYTVDKHGMVNNCEDIGFAAIGIGAWHARSRFMQSGFVNNWTAAYAWATVIAAKKAADIAPGVSKSTDYHLIFRNELRPMWPDMLEKMERQYEEFEAGRTALALHAVQQLDEFIEARWVNPGRDGQSNREC